MLCYVVNALLNYNAKFTKMCTVDCTRNKLFLHYDSGAENTAFLQIFIKNSTEKKQLMSYFLCAIFDINYNSIVATKTTARNYCPRTL